MEEYIREGGIVAVVDNLSTGRKHNIHPDAEFHKVSVESPELKKVFKQFKPDIVNHHAAQIDVRCSVADPVFDAKVNITGTINLLENCVRYNCKKVIFASTGGAIYGEQEFFPADESHPTLPLSPYGIAKLSAEKYLFYYKHNYGLDYISLRYSNVYGPRQDPYGETGVIAIFIQKMLKGEQPIINGDGKQTRDFVYVGDAADANLRALNSEQTGTFNIGTSIETDINSIFKKLANIIGKDFQEVHGPVKPGEQKRSVISYKKAERLLGWKPRVSLEQGLKQTVNFFKK